jgi:hypothetical protein
VVFAVTTTTVVLTGTAPGAEGFLDVIDEEDEELEVVLVSEEVEEVELKLDEEDSEVELEDSVDWPSEEVPLRVARYPSISMGPASLVRRRHSGDKRRTAKDLVDIFHHPILVIARKACTSESALIVDTIVQSLFPFIVVAIALGLFGATAETSVYAFKLDASLLLTSSAGNMIELYLGRNHLEC